MQWLLLTVKVYVKVESKTRKNLFCYDFALIFFFISHSATVFIFGSSGDILS